MYLRVFMRLILHVKDLKPCEGGTLLAFNDSSTRPCGTIDLPVSFGEGKNKRILKVCFLVIPYKNIYNGLLGRSFLAALNKVASMVHLKMEYHNSSYELVVIATNLRGAHLIQETVLKNPIMSAITFEREKKKDWEAIGMVYIYIQDNKILRDDQFSSSSGSIRRP